MTPSRGNTSSAAEHFPIVEAGRPTLMEGGD